MKKSIPALLTIFLSSLVSAGPVEGVEQLLRGLGQVIVLILEFVVEPILNISSVDEILFAKILLFTITLLVVYTIIKKNPILGDNKAILWIVSSSIAILSIRFIPDNFIQAILLQYSTLGVALTVFLPMIIYFFFIQQSGIGPFGRRIGWVVFAGVFFAMWSFMGGDLGEANWIYGIGALFILLSIIFDSSIHKYFGMSAIRGLLKDSKVNLRVKAQIELESLTRNAHHYTTTEYAKLRKKWMKIIEDNIA